MLFENVNISGFVKVGVKLLNTMCEWCCGCWYELCLHGEL